MSDEISEIKRLLKSDKLIIGKQETLKGLKRSEVAKVYVAKNCPKTLKEDIAYYASLAQIPVVEIDTPNDEFGQVCKKPYAISVVAVKA